MAWAIIYVMIVSGGNQKKKEKTMFGIHPKKI